MIKALIVNNRRRTNKLLCSFSIVFTVRPYFKLNPCVLFVGLLTLIKVKKDSPPFIGEKATAKIHDTIIRLGKPINFYAPTSVLESVLLFVCQFV